MLNSLRMKKVRWYLFPLHSCESVWITQIERRSTHHAGSFWCERHDNTCICKLRSFTECSRCYFSSMLDNSCYVIAAVFEGDAPTGTAATAGDNGYRLQICLIMSMTLCCTPVCPPVPNPPDWTGIWWPRWRAGQVTHRDWILAGSPLCSFN